MRADDLRLFQAIAREGSLRKAASSLGISQPSATQALHRLEDQLGAQLVHRSSGGSALTEIGASALPHAEALLRTETRLFEEVQALLDLEKGRLRLGASGAVTTALLIPVLRRLAADHPGLELQITEAGSVEITGLVATGELEIGIVRRAQVLGPPEGPVVVEDLRPTRLVVCVPDGHEWVGTRSSVELSELGGQALVLPRGGYLSNEIVRRRLTGGRARVVCRTEHPAAARALVAHGFGITLATEEEARRGSVRYIRVTDGEAGVWTSIVQRRSAYTATVAKRFLRVFKEHLAGAEPASSVTPATKP